MREAQRGGWNERCGQGMIRVSVKVALSGFLHQFFDELFHTLGPQPVA